MAEESANNNIGTEAALEAVNAITSHLGELAGSGDAIPEPGMY